MGLVFSRRVGTDPYYANYEKAFERLEKESNRVVDRRVKRRKTMEAVSSIAFWTTTVLLCLAVLFTAWIQQVPDPKWYRKSLRILASFAVPVVAVLLFKGLLWLLRLAEARDERFLRKLMESKRKMIKDLKDSTRFDKTMALIKKYDPDAEPVHSPKAPLSATAASGSLRRRLSTAANGSATHSAIHTPGPRPGGMTPGNVLMRASSVAAAATANVAAGTGKALMPVFDKLATNLVGDNPVLLQEAHNLREENSALKAKLAEIEARLNTSHNGTNGAEPLPDAPSSGKRQVAQSG